MDLIERAQVGEGEEVHQSLLDRCATSLNETLSKCLTDSTPKKKRGRTKGFAYWDDEMDSIMKERREKEKLLTLIRQEEEDRQEETEQLILEIANLSKKGRRALQRKKKNYFRDQIEKVKQPSDIYKISKWGQSTRQLPVPPLRDVVNQRVYSTPEDKASFLLRELLPPMRELEVEPPPILPVAPATRLDHAPLQKHEAKKAIFSPDPNKSPGMDNISYHALRNAWEVIGDHIVLFLSTLLRVGWHPRAYRTAILCALAKPGKRDPSLPRSYRLIALLPCLGKVLERIVAARLTHFAIKKNLVPPEQFGGMPGRSTTDAVHTLVHDIHAGWYSEKRRVTSALAFDVQGAFDSVHPDRLTKLLDTHNLPLALVKWVKAFLSERKAAVRLDHFTGKLEPVSSGIPQGSPVSPILFLLFSAPLFGLLNERARRDQEGGPPTRRSLRVLAFVDDGLIYCSTQIDQTNPDKAARTNNRHLEEAYHTLLEFANSNGLNFDPKKKELIHFPPLGINITLPTIHLQDGAVEPCPMNQAIRWLGIWLDPALTFIQHVAKMAHSATRVVFSMKMLSNTIRGLTSSQARMIFVGAVQPIMYYGASVWWSGLYRTEWKRNGGWKQLMNKGQKPLAAKLGKAHREGLRNVIPCYRTTATEALEREAAIAPVIVQLDYIRRRESIRLTRLHTSHPLLARAYSSQMSQYSRPQNQAAAPPIRFGPAARADKRPRFTTPLQDLAAAYSINPPEFIKPTPIAPWKPKLTSEKRVTKGRVGKAGCEKAALRHSKLVEKLMMNEANLIVYTDGSRLELDRRGESISEEEEEDRHPPRPGRIGVGAGYSIWHQYQEVANGNVPMGSRAEVFDAEAVALNEGFKQAIHLIPNSPQLSCISRIFVFLDNSAVLSLALNSPVCSSQNQFEELEKNACAWLERNPSNRIHLDWVPGHTDIEGNEKADQQAKDGAKGRATFGSTSSRPTNAFAKRESKRRRELDWRKLWESNTKEIREDSYRKYAIHPPSSTPRTCLKWQRKYYSRLVQARTGHGDFAAYHEKYKHEEARRTCPHCLSSPTSNTHPFHCASLSDSASQHLRNDKGERLSVEEILDSKKGELGFLNFIKATNAFHQLPPPSPPASRSPSEHSIE